MKAVLKSNMITFHTSSKINDNILDLDAFNFDDSLLSQPINVVDTSNVPSPLSASAVTAGSDIFDLKSYPDELFLSFLTPPELKSNDQPTQKQNFAQSNTSMAYSMSVAAALKYSLFLRITILSHLFLSHCICMFQHACSYLSSANFACLY